MLYNDYQEDFMKKYSVFSLYVIKINKQKFICECIVPDEKYKEILNSRKFEIKNGIFGPAPTRFGGERPESEPETAALCDLCRTKRMRHVLALHSQGEVIYWTFGDKKPPKSERMAQIMATSSGYALDVPMGLAVGGGFKDWFICEFNRPGFTVEVGTGKNPLPIENSLNIYKGICEMLSLSAIM